MTPVQSVWRVSRGDQLKVSLRLFQDCPRLSLMSLPISWKNPFVPLQSFFRSSIGDQLASVFLSSLQPLMNPLLSSPRNLPDAETAWSQVAVTLPQTAAMAAGSALKASAVAIAARVICLVAPLKKRVSGFHASTITAAANATAAATKPMGDVNTPITVARPIAAPVITVNARAPTASACTSAGLSATNCPNAVARGISAVTILSKAGNSACPIFSEILSSALPSASRCCAVSPSPLFAA